MNSCGGDEEEDITAVLAVGVVEVWRSNRPPKIGAATNPPRSLMAVPLEKTGGVCLGVSRWRGCRVVTGEVGHKLYRNFTTADQTNRGGGRPLE